MKDRWDKMQILFTLIFTIFGGFVGGLSSNLVEIYFRQEEATRQQVEIVEKFMPYLIGEKDGKPYTNPDIAQQNTIIVIAALGNEDLAINLAKFNPNSASIQTLKDIALSNTEKDKALKAVESIVDIGKNTPKLLDIARVALTSMMLKEPINQKDFSKRRIEISTKAKESLSLLPSSTASKASSQPPSTPKSGTFRGWGIVIGSDSDLEGAKYEQQQAKQKDSPETKSIEIFKRQGWYATVVTNVSDEDKNQTLQNWQNKFRQGSFLIDFEKWCGTDTPTPKPSQEKSEYYECK